MICFPNAKINLGLNILSRRTDGYHNIETVFYPVGIRDALEIVSASSSKSKFVQSGIPITGDPELNLVQKAYRLIKEKYEVPEVDIYLRKNIPFGAGLGGGSADAAFMLKLLNEFASLGLDNTELESIASQIGADCPFFIQNKPVFASGIGNIFERVSLSLSGYYLILIIPPVHVSTKVAYSGVVPEIPAQSLRDIINRPVSQWKDVLQNDFEKSVFAQYPIINEVKHQLYKNGALYASMSGSGSSVFGIFEQERDLKSKFENCKVFNMSLEI